MEKRSKVPSPSRRAGNPPPAQQEQQPRRPIILRIRVPRSVPIETGSVVLASSMDGGDNLSPFTARAPSPPRRTGDPTPQKEQQPRQKIILRIRVPHAAPMETGPGSGDDKLPLAANAPPGEQPAYNPKSKREENRRKLFSPQLSRAEIEEDFMLMTGARRVPRPKKKHSEDVKKIIQRITPGSCLREITPQMYDIPQEKKSHEVDN